MAEKDNISALETYILSSDKQSAIKSFPPASSFGHFLKANLLLKEGQFNCADFEEAVKELEKSDKNLYSIMAIRKDIKELEFIKDKEKINNKIDEINLKFMKNRFDYPIPESSDIKEKNEFSSNLSKNLFPKIIDSGTLSTKIFSNLTPQGKLKIDAENLDKELFKNLLINWTKLYALPGIPEKINELTKEDNFHYVKCFKYMSLQQMDNLLKINKNILNHSGFVKSFLYKKYFYKIGNDDLENYEIYSRVWEEIKEYPEKLNSLKTVTLLSLLNLGIKFGIYNEELFKKYLLIHKSGSIYSLNNEDIDRKIKKFAEFGYGNWKNDQVLVEDYLEEVLKNKENPNKYKWYFEAKFLRKSFATIKLQNGASPVEFEDIITHDDLASLASDITLEPCKDNPTSFHRNELVKFSIKTKNVQNLRIKVYEINVKSYLLKHSSNNDLEDICLEGLTAKYEKNYEYSESPLIKTRRILEFPEFTNKAGLFIIEIIGNGRSSRAIIKKGSLKYVWKMTAAGQLIMVLDEENKICKGNGAGIYVDGRFYSCENKDGCVLLPFANEKAVKNIILTDGIIADLAEDFSHYIENYELKAIFFVHEEQLLIGNKATISIKPSLYINGVKTFESLLSDCEAVVTTIDSDQISSSKKFSDFSLSDENFIINLEIQVPARLKNLSISFTGKIENISKNKKITLEEEFSIDVNNHSDNNAIYGAYLNFGNDGYQIEIKGNNGEFYQNLQVEVILEHRDWVSTRSEILKTDEIGKIYLGKLIDIVNLSIKLKFPENEQQFDWNLELFKKTVQYPNTINLCEGDEFRIPVDFNTVNIKNISLISVYDYTIIDIFNQNLHFDYENSVILLKNMSKGTYELNINLDTIHIHISEGIHWGDNEFILSKNLVIPTYNQYKTLMINSTSIEENKLKIKLGGDYENASIYALYFNNLSDSLIKELIQFSSLYELPARENQKFYENESDYEPSRKLDEEYQYVLERKYQPRFIGNTLQKPQLLLKRNFSEDTSTNIQKAEQGENIKDKKFDNFYHSLSGLRSKNTCFRGKCENSGQNFDFIEYPAIWKFDIDINDGIAEIPIDNFNYRQVFVIVTNGEGFSYEIFSVPNVIAELKDMRLQESLDSSKCFSETIKSKAVFIGESFKINDVASTNYEIIDSIEKLYRIQKELIKLNKSSTNYDNWDFLGKWGNLVYDKKLEIYDNFISHELNIFLYKKDPKFFKEVIEPHLKCKMEKDIVDLYLLSEPLDQYLNLGDLSRLNTLEKVLLIDRISENNPDFAVSLAKVLKDEADSISINRQIRNKQRELVLRYNLSGEFPVFEPINQCESPWRGKKDKEKDKKHDKRMPIKCDGSSDLECEEVSSESSEEDEKEEHETLKKGMALFGKKKLDDARQNKQIPAYYQKLDTTKEFCETFYYGVKNISENKNLVPNSSFWSYLANLIANKSSLLLSEEILGATSSLTELVCALAFTDLPFIPKNINYLHEKNSIIYTANSNFLIFYKELYEANSEINNKILVAQNYFDIQNSEKHINQFIKQKIYACQVVLTNTSGSKINVTLLAEIPQGSIPVGSTKYLQNPILSLENFHTQTFEYFFYFPKSGIFTHFSANISYEGKVIAKTEPQILNVEDAIRTEKIENFDDLILSGRNDLILEYLNIENLFNKEKGFDILKICWMMKDLDLWRKTVDILKRRNMYFREIWSFSIFHHDLEVFKEFISLEPGILSQLGNFFESSTISTGICGCRHIEFDPIVNARAHKLGNQSKITNNRFKEIYKHFLEFLSEKPCLDIQDKLAFVQYLIYQDRVEEAIEIYETIPLKQSIDIPGQSYFQIQYDYLSCYLDIDKSSSIASLYKNYPISTWKNLFSEVTNLLKEINAQDAQSIEKSIDNEPYLLFSIEKGTLILNYQNVNSCKIRIYKIDLEILFSKNPFLIENTQDFTFVKPNFEISINLSKEGVYHYQIPNEFSKENIMIEIDDGTCTISKSHFSTNLKINVLERYGIIKVMSENLMPKAASYVKIFVKRNNGSVEFYKDGYTDVSGNFDYVSLNSDTLSTIQKFSILVVDDELGSLVQEVNPPPQQ